MLYAIIALIVIIADQWVKFWVASNIVLDTQVVSFIPGFVSLMNIHNEGAAFGFLSGANAKMFFVILSAVFAVAVIIGLATRFLNGPISRWSAVMVAAGGLANSIDRLLYGYVQDMFRFDFAPKFAIFNVADIFITVFCILFIIDLIFGGEYGLFGKKKAKDEEDEEDLDDEEEEEDEEPEKPVKAKKASRKSKKHPVEDDEEEDEEEEDLPTASVKKAAPARQKRQTEYEEYKSRRSAAAAEAEAAPAEESSDPFEAWNKANAAAQAEKQNDTFTIRTEEAPAKVVKAAPAAAPKAAPVKAKTEAAPKASAPEEEFNLDDILAEFK